MQRRHQSAPKAKAHFSTSTPCSFILHFKKKKKKKIDCASACASSKDCKSYQYCGFGSFNGTCAFAPEKKDGKDVTPTPAFASKGDCSLANGTSWRQAPSKPEYGGWTFGIGCKAEEVADAQVEKEEGMGGGTGEEPVKKAPAAAAAAAAAAAVAPARPTTPAPTAVEEPISPLRKPSSAKAAAPAAVEAGAADPNAPEVVAVAPKNKPAAPAVAAATPAAVSKAPVAPAAPAAPAAATAATTEPKAKGAAAPAAPAAKAPAAAATKPASKAAVAPAAAPAVVDPAAPVGPAGPGSLSAPIKGYLSGRASVAELQPGVESAAECASICAAAEKNAASFCAGYSWCGAPAGCPGNVATGVCQLWSGKAGSGKLAANDSGWVSAAREAASAPAAGAAAAQQPPMETQSAVGN